MRFYLMLHSGERDEITAFSYDEALKAAQAKAEKCGETVEVLHRIGHAGYDYSVMAEDVADGIQE